MEVLTMRKLYVDDRTTGRYFTIELCDEDIANIMAEYDWDDVFVDPDFDIIEVRVKGII